jgi:hypothetical protein
MMVGTNSREARRATDQTSCLLPQYGNIWNEASAISAPVPLQPVMGPDD